MTDASLIQIYDFKIANGGTTSQELNLEGKTLAGLFFPSALTSTSMTILGAEKSGDAGGTFVTVYKDGANLSYTVAASKYLVIDPADTAGLPFIKIVLGSAEGGARTIEASLIPILNRA